MPERPNPRRPFWPRPRRWRQRRRPPPPSLTPLPPPPPLPYPPLTTRRISSHPCRRHGLGGVGRRGPATARSSSQALIAAAGCLPLSSPYVGPLLRCRHSASAPVAAGTDRVCAMAMRGGRIWPLPVVACAGWRGACRPLHWLLSGGRRRRGHLVHRCPTAPAAWDCRGYARAVHGSRIRLLHGTACVGRWPVTGAGVWGSEVTSEDTVPSVIDRHATASHPKLLPFAGRGSLLPSLRRAHQAPPMGGRRRGVQRRPPDNLPRRHSSPGKGGHSAHRKRPDPPCRGFGTWRS